MGSVLEPLGIASDPEPRTVTVTANATIPTFFMRVLGTDSTDVAATAEATLASRHVDVSLVLDAPGSLQHDMDDPRAAANQLVDNVVEALQAPFYSRIALLLYTAAQNVTY